MKILPTSGLVDQSFKYRHRHVDLMLNPQVRSIFYTRSKIVNSIRQYLNSELFRFHKLFIVAVWQVFVRAGSSFIKAPEVELRAIFVDLMLNPYFSTPDLYKIVNSKRQYLNYELFLFPQAFLKTRYLLLPSFCLRRKSIHAPKVEFLLTWSDNIWIGM